MSDIISRKAAIDAIITLWANKPFGNPALTEIKECVERVPSAQPEIVRCEYCNKSKEWPNGRWCSLFRASVNADSYCSFGAKRKEGREE